MKVGIYVRVSTADRGQDPELQLKPLREYAKAREWMPFEYADVGESGASQKRPALDRLLGDARKRRIDVVLVWKLDRFARSLKSLLGTLDELRALGVQFVSYTENLDFSTPAGRAMVSLIGAFAEFERDLIRERVRAGLENARNKGKRIGRRPLIDMARLRTVAHMRSRGMSVRRIARDVGISKSLVHKTLKNLDAETVSDQGARERQTAVHQRGE